MKIRVLDLFCGAGGSSQGAVQAGAELVGAIDSWDIATKTFKDNHPGALVLNERLASRSRPSKSILGRGVDLLLASPECTNHSVAKGNSPRCEESRRSANYILNFVKELNPRWVVLENVIQMRDWDGFNPLIARLEDFGFGVTSQVLDAADFGVPQTRRRLFVLCERDSKPAKLDDSEQRRRLPAKSFVRQDGKWPSRPLYAPKRAEATIERAERAISSLGRGTSFLVVYYGSDGAGGWQPLDRPIRTLTTLDRFGLVTWQGRTPYLRMLQVEELRRAMGFPLDYLFMHGTRRDKVKLLGNGVCPPMMEAVVRHLTASRRATTGIRVRSGRGHGAELIAA